MTITLPRHTTGHSGPGPPPVRGVNPTIHGGAMRQDGGREPGWHRWPVRQSGPAVALGRGGVRLGAHLLGAHRVDGDGGPPGRCLGRHPAVVRDDRGGSPDRRRPSPICRWPAGPRDRVAVSAPGQRQSVEAAAAAAHRPGRVA